MKRFVLAILILCLVALAAPAAASAATYDEAVDQLVADGYTVQLENYLTGLGDSPLGFRIAGSPAEVASSQYVFDQLAAMGLSDVAMERVPVDAWEFRGASVMVGDRELVASSFAGVPGTDGPITAPLVYVGGGTRQDFDAVGDVTGKLVLVDADLEDWWVNFVGSEATMRHARGVVMTHGDITYPWYQYPDALGGNDGEYDDDYVPMVYVAWQDGDWLKEQLAAGAVEATMEADITITLAENGGKGYNVVGVLPGKDPSLEPILLASHVDAHFRAGLDDTGAVVNELLMAKAMTMAGVKPERSIVFFFTCGEEYGYTDCWYDWAVGAWYAITQEHADWAGNLALMLNIEAMARNGSSLLLRGWPDVVNAMAAVADENPELLPWGYATTMNPSSWTDQWSFSAMGVPTVTTSATGADYDFIYHTNLETKALVDHDYLGDIAKYQFRVLQRLDGGVLPYDLSARGDQLLRTIQAGKLVRAGVGKQASANFQAAAAAFRNAAWQWELRKAATREAKLATVNNDLVAIEKLLNTTFTSRDQWDWPAYPWEAPQQDAIYLAKAIAAAQVGNTARARQMITWWTGINWYLELFSVPVIKQDLTRHYPDYKHVTWGAIGNPPLVVDAVDEWVALGEGDTATAIAGLEEDRAMVRADLRTRVADMTAVLKDLTKRVKAL